MVNLYKHFHDHIKKSRLGSKISIDPKDWPEDWKTIYFKEYPRFTKVKLTLSRLAPSFNLLKALSLIKSDREFSEKAIDIKTLSQLLVYSAGIQEKLKSLKVKDWNQTHRTYPSGGGCYPLEFYPLVLRPIKELPAGVYHFNVKENALEKLWTVSGLDFKKLLIGDWDNAALIILISAVFDRTMNKYKDFGYRLIWAECGHIGQNFYLVSKMLGLKCCACAGVDEDYANELLDLDGETESILMAYVFGK